MSKKKASSKKLPTATYPKLSRFFAPTTTTSKKRVRGGEDDDDNDEAADMTHQVEEENSLTKATFVVRKEASDKHEDNVVVILDDDDDDGDDDDDSTAKEQHDNDDETPPYLQTNDTTMADLPLIAENDVHEEDNTEKIEIPAHESAVEQQPRVELTEGTSSARNPFSQFAFSSSTSPQKQGSLTKWMKNTATTTTSSTAANKKKKPRTFQSGGTEWIKMEDLPKQERDKVIAKWHGLADPNASMEDRRFQVLVAARLHARCQEPVVRSAMINFRHALNGNLSVASVAKANPQELAPAINNLQYFNTKALHIVKAAQEIKSQFAGVVPESEHLLKQLTGIGPVIADLLAYVNTRARHAKSTSTTATTTTDATNR